MSPDPADATAARAAVAWFALMRGPRADDKRDAFEEWLSDPANAQAYESVVSTWDQSMFVARTDIGRDRDLGRARFRRAPFMLVAASIAAVALACGGLVVVRQGRPWSPGSQGQVAADIVADRTAIRMVSLADGSRLILDRDAVVRDLSTAGERHFALLRGRARFNVAHDARRPFVVDAGAGRVIAHGTMFDVALETEGVRVSLLRGVVEVQNRDARGVSTPRPRFLQPGQQLVVVVDKLSDPMPTDAMTLGWPDPMISFDRIPLARAVEAFNRSSPRQIELDGVGIGRQPLSGAFRRDDPDGFAQGVAASLGLTVGQRPNGAIVLRAGGPPAR